jgi:hypothetical protein
MDPRLKKLLNKLDAIDEKWEYFEIQEAFFLKYDGYEFKVSETEVTVMKNDDFVYHCFGPWEIDDRTAIGDFFEKLLRKRATDLEKAAQFRVKCRLEQQIQFDKWLE